MGWIDFRENKPKEMILALVHNEKGWMSYVQAHYHPEWEAWILYDANYREPITLEVSHYLQIPTPPRLDRG